MLYDHIIVLIYMQFQSWQAELLKKTERKKFVLFFCCDPKFLSYDKQEVASKLEIKAMPTFVLMKNGAPNYMVVGANPVELKKRIKAFIYG